jgi:hypothetical protein
MAKKIKAIRTYCPRIQLGPIADIAEVAKHISKNTCIHPGMVHQTFMELPHIISFLLNSGRPVRLPGTGIFTPTMALDGTVNVKLRVDKALSKKLNDPTNTFFGKIINKSNIGKKTSQLIVLWNENHTDDLIKS